MTSHPITRRGLVRAGAAALGSVGLSASPSALASPALDMDADLVAAMHRHGEAIEVLRAAEEGVDSIYDARIAAHPSWPKALLWRPDDFPRTSLGIGLSDPVGYGGMRAYGDRAIAWLRDSPAGAFFSGQSCPPERETRRREIIEAHDAWDAECRAVADRVGYTAAVAASEAACEAANDAEAVVMALPARTLAGLTAKAAWVLAQVESGAMEFIPDDFVREVAAFGASA